MARTSEHAKSSKKTEIPANTIVQKMVVTFQPSVLYSHTNEYGDDRHIEFSKTDVFIKLFVRFSSEFEGCLYIYIYIFICSKHIQFTEDNKIYT